MFVDLDWLLNVSSPLSASAELLVRDRMTFLSPKVRIHQLLDQRKSDVGNSTTAYDYCGHKKVISVVFSFLLVQNRTSVWEKLLLFYWIHFMIPLHWLSLNVMYGTARHQTLPFQFNANRFPIKTELTDSLLSLLSCILHLHPAYYLSNWNLSIFSSLSSFPSNSLSFCLLCDWYFTAFADKMTGLLCTPMHHLWTHFSQVMHRIKILPTPFLHTHIHHHLANRMN